MIGHYNPVREAPNKKSKMRMNRERRNAAKIKSTTTVTTAGRSNTENERGGWLVPEWMKRQV